MSKLKTVLVLIIGILVVLLILQNNVVKQLQAQISSLQAGNRESDNLRAENERLKSNVVGKAELARLRQADAELMRLRNERGTRKQQPIKVANTNTVQTGSTDNPETESFSAKVQARVGPNEVLVVGGWQSKGGKRNFVLITPSSVQTDDAPNGIAFENEIISVPEGGLEKLGLDSLKADGSQSSAQMTISREQREATMSSIGTNQEVRIIGIGKITISDGTFGQVSAGSTPPGNLGLVPTITVGGKHAENGAWDISADIHLDVRQ